MHLTYQSGPCGNLVSLRDWQLTTTKSNQVTGPVAASVPDVVEQINATLGAWYVATEGMNGFFFCHCQIKGTTSSSTHTE